MSMLYRWTYLDRRRGNDEQDKLSTNFQVYSALISGLLGGCGTKNVLP